MAIAIKNKKIETSKGTKIFNETANSVLIFTNVSTIHREKPFLFIFFTNLITLDVAIHIKRNTFKQNELNFSCTTFVDFYIL